jgi:hypothetical protein
MIVFASEGLPEGFLTYTEGDGMALIVLSLAIFAALLFIYYFDGE